MPIAAVVAVMAVIRKAIFAAVMAVVAVIRHLYLKAPIVLKFYIIT
jgi:hypothetical protein